MSTLAGQTGALPDNAAPYRALVCIALGGGADSFNMLVPTDAVQYQHYRDRRSNLALTDAELLSLPGADEAGRRYAVHHGLREMRDFFKTGDVAFVANTGPLHSSTSNTPELSHSNLIARWQHGGSDRNSGSGWAGRVADILAGGNANLSGPTNVSLAGENAMQLGALTQTLCIARHSYFNRSQLPPGSDFSYFNEQLASQAKDRRRIDWLQRCRPMPSVKRAAPHAAMKDANRDTHALDTRFPPGSFSADLEFVALNIAAYRKLGVRRQIFFVQFDGWDHHHQLRRNQARMLPMLSRGLAAFREALVEIGEINNVTTFTTSDFGRSLVSNGTGSDHGWGGHHVVMGGAVSGGRVYGRYPDLAAGGVSDIGGGVFEPTTALEEYLGEMATWLGIRSIELPYVLPDMQKLNLQTDSSRPIGLLG